MFAPKANQRETVMYSSSSSEEAETAVLSSSQCCLCDERSTNEGGN